MVYIETPEEITSPRKKFEKWYAIFQTRIGWIGATASEKGITRTTLPSETKKGCTSVLKPVLQFHLQNRDRFNYIQEKLERLFNGEPESFNDIPIDYQDSSLFFRRAWETCKSIPQGETRSYKWVATKIGSPRAYRAIGQSMAKNPLPIIIPCHSET